MIVLNQRFATQSCQHSRFQNQRKWRNSKKLTIFVQPSASKRGEGKFWMHINSLKTKLIQIIVKNLVHASKGTPYFTVTNISLLMLCRKIVAAYTECENCRKSINTKCNIYWLIKKVGNSVFQSVVRVTPVVRKAFQASRRRWEIADSCLLVGINQTILSYRHGTASLS